MVVQRGWKDVCSSVAACILIIIVIVSAIIGIVGTVKYISEKRAESAYKETKCFVETYTIIKKTCSSETCSGSGIFRTCTRRHYACNKESYTVKYNVSTGQIIETTLTQSMGEPGPNSVNQTYTCFYDSTNFNLFRWKWPQPRTYLIVQWIGWIAFGVSTLLVIGLFIWMCCFRNKSATYNQLS